MGRRKPGKYPYDYTAGDDRRWCRQSRRQHVAGAARPGSGHGITEGVVCRVEALGQDGALLDEAEAGKLGKEHRLHGTTPGDRVDVTVSAHKEPGAGGELTATRTVVLTGDLDDVVRFGVGPARAQVAAVDAGELPSEPSTPTPTTWGAGVRLRGARPA